MQDLLSIFAKVVTALDHKRRDGACAGKRGIAVPG
jgi:hypothetical protein